MSDFNTMDTFELKDACIANYGDNAIKFLCDLGGDPDMVICDYAAHCASVPDNFRAMFHGAGAPTASGAHAAVLRAIKHLYFARMPREAAAATVAHISRHDGDTVCICPGEPGLTFGPSAYADAWHDANLDQEPII